jgi:hypothetical protein
MPFGLSWLLEAPSHHTDQNESINMYYNDIHIFSEAVVDDMNIPAFTGARRLYVRLRGR